MSKTKYPYQIVPRVTKAESYKNRPISVLNLSVVSANVLHNMNIKTIGELMKYSASDLAKYRSFNKPIVGIIHALDELGLKLKGADEFLAQRRRNRL